MRLDERLQRIERAAATRNRPTGSLILREGVDGTAEEIRQRAAEEIAQHGRGPIVVFCAAPGPEDPPMPRGVIRFDPECADL